MRVFLLAGIALALAACGSDDRAGGGSGGSSTGGASGAGAAGAAGASPELAFFVETPAGEQAVTRAFWGDQFVVRATGIEPNATVTLSARADIVNNEYESTATFVADADGRIDLASMAPEQGSWSGVDTDGLVWSMAKAADGEDRLPFDQLRVSIEQGGNEIVAGALDRHYLADDVVETNVGEQGLVGVLYAKQGASKRPVIITFGGSEGGLTSGRYAAMYWAALGYTTLGLAYFAEAGLPATLEEIPLEYFDGARNYLAARPEADADRVAVMGGSRGGELALLLGASFPWVKAVVAELPSGVLWGAPQWSGPEKSSWTLAGAGLPFVSGDPTAQPTTSVDTDGTTLWHYTPTFQAAIAAATPTEIDLATPRVEQTTGPILMIAGADDQVWPACDLAKLAFARLESTGHASARADQLLCFDEAGHNILRPGSPTLGSHRAFHPVTKQWLALGGTAAGVAHAQRQADQAIRALLKSALGE